MSEQIFDLVNEYELFGHSQEPVKVRDQEEKCLVRLGMVMAKCDQIKQQLSEHFLTDNSLNVVGTSLEDVLTELNGISLFIWQERDRQTSLNFINLSGKPE